MTNYKAKKSLEDILKEIENDLEFEHCPYVFYTDDKGFAINTVDAMRIVEVVLYSCMEDKKDEF